MWKTVAIFILFLSVLISGGLHGIQNWKSARFQKMKTGVKYTKGVALTATQNGGQIEPVDLTSCAAACLTHNANNCSGFNYAEKDPLKEEVPVCELFSFPMNTTSIKLQSAGNESEFYVKNVCQNGEMLQAVPLANNNVKMTCVCPYLVRGDFCQLKCTVDVCDNCKIQGYDIFDMLSNDTVRNEPCFQRCFQDPSCLSVRYSPVQKRCYGKRTNRYVVAPKDFSNTTDGGTLESFVCNDTSAATP